MNHIICPIPDWPYHVDTIIWLLSVPYGGPRLSLWFIALRLAKVYFRGTSTHFQPDSHAQKSLFTPYSCYFRSNQLNFQVNSPSFQHFLTSLTMKMFNRTFRWMIIMAVTSDYIDFAWYVTNKDLLIQSWGQVRVDELSTRLCRIQ